MMRVRLAVFLACAMPLFAQKESEKAASDTFQKVGVVQGKIVKKPMEKEFQVEINHDWGIPIPRNKKIADKKLQEVKNLNKQVSSLPKNSPLRVQKLADFQNAKSEYDLLAQQQTHLFKKGTAIKVLVASDPTVRWRFPREGSFDDKGNIKIFSKKEIAELKGQGNLPGFKGSYEDLKEGQEVMVLLGQKKMEKPELDEDPHEKPFYSGLLMILNNN